MKRLNVLVLATFLASPAFAAGGERSHFSWLAQPGSQSLSGADPLRMVDAFPGYEPMTQDEREAITLDQLRLMGQDDLDVMYSRLSSGPFPVGVYEGTVVFDDGDDNVIENILARIDGSGRLESFVKKLGLSLWKGKTFRPETKSLTNRVGGQNHFVAPVFCGKSLLDSRKESIVFDYSNAAVVADYDPKLDWLMTGFGLNVRDEVRMVKPGMYLGRAYVHKAYALNFILTKANLEASEQTWQNSCKTPAL